MGPFSVGNSSMATGPPFPNGWAGSYVTTHQPAAWSFGSIRRFRVRHSESGILDRPTTQWLLQSWTQALVIALSEYPGSRENPSLHVYRQNEKRRSSEENRRVSCSGLLQGHSHNLWCQSVSEVRDQKVKQSIRPIVKEYEGRESMRRFGDGVIRLCARMFIPDAAR